MKYSLQDLIDIEQFQELQDRLNEICSFPSSIVDNDGKILTATAWQDVCTKFHRQNKDAEKICIKSDQYIKEHIHEANPALTYRCPHGLVDNATPIVIDGVHYGNFFTGQFFLEEPDLEFFRTQAHKYGFDEEEYIQAVKKVPIWTQKQLDNYLFFIKGLIAVISESGLKRLKEIENRKEIEKSENRYRSILKASLDGYWLVDTKGRLLDVNESYCRMSGYGEKELLKMSISDLEVVEAPEFIEHYLEKVISTGSDRFESKHRRKDGTSYDVEISVQSRAEEGQCVFFIRDITDRKRAEKASDRIKWMLGTGKSRESRSESHVPEYGDLTLLNRSGLILNAVGKDMLAHIVGDYLDMLDTSAAVYELTGDYALGIFSSGWCQFMDKSSRNLCGTDDNLEALTCGRWRCHESCWTCASKLSIETGQPVDIQCDGGINLYAVPIVAGEKIVGSINVGYGDPPTEQEELKVLAEKYGVSIQQLKTLSLAYESRPPFIIELAKRRLQVSARLIGEIVERRLVEKERIVLQERLRSLWNVAQMTEASHKELCDLVLEEVQKLTSSQYSFFGFINDDETSMTIHSWSKDAMTECHVQDNPVHFPIDKAGIWSCAITDHKPLIVNDYNEENSKKRGLPEGHVSIRNFLSVPVLRKGHAIAIAVVANKDCDYTEEDAKQVKAFVSNILLLIEKRIADQSMQESEEKYRSIMESMDESTSICSADFRLEYMNPAMVRRVGRDATGEVCYEALYGLNDICPWCVNERVVNGETIKSELHRPDTNETFLVTHSPVFHADGTVSKLSIFRDITEFKNVEARLQQAQKMESIGTLAGGIAHDFNNILFPIVGLSEMLIEDLEPETIAHENAKEIFSAGKRGSELVNQILAFSRQSETKMIPVSVQRVMNEVLKLCRSTIPTSIEIVHNIRNDCGMVRADPIQIHQIVMNLITNAYHAVELEKGQISVELEEKTLLERDLEGSTFAPGRYAVITISDNGHGIDPAHMEQIFEPYFTTKEQGKGTGLGLSVVHGIVKDHRGAIQVDSKPNEGTTFTVSIPIIESKPVRELVNDELQIPMGQEHILLVDDEESVVRMMRQILERLGYQVSPHIDSVEALQAFKANPQWYDLVLSDMTMPNMSGDSLTKEILTIRQDIPVIICTGFSERMDEVKAKMMGIKGYLMKPVLRLELAQMVRNVLDGEKALM